MTTPTNEERIRVLRAAGFNETWSEHQQAKAWAHPHSILKWPLEKLDLTRDDFAAKYLLPVIQPISFQATFGATGMCVITRFLVGSEGAGDMNVYTAEPRITAGTFGEALHAFVLALLDAGVISEVPA